jgi:hypothetical protein
MVPMATLNRAAARLLVSRWPLTAQWYRRAVFLRDGYNHAWWQAGRECHQLALKG